MRSSNLVFLIGRHRSGTTVFRDLLESCGGFNCHEVMSANVEAVHGFYNFVARRVAEDPKYVWPIRHQGLFPEYIDELRKSAGNRKLLLDLKYWGLNLIPVSEDVTSERPFLIDFIHRRKAHAIQIVRRNKLRLIASDEILKKTGKWFQRAGDMEQTEKPKVEIDVSGIVAEIDRLEHLDNIIRKLVAPLPGGHEIVYEEMFDDAGDFSNKVVEIAKKIMDVQNASKTPRLKKMNPEPLADLVANYDALAEALAATPHAWMLTDAH